MKVTFNELKVDVDGAGGARRADALAPVRTSEHGGHGIPSGAAFGALLAVALGPPRHVVGPSRVAPRTGVDPRLLSEGDAVEPLRPSLSTPIAAPVSADRTHQAASAYAATGDGRLAGRVDPISGNDRGATRSPTEAPVVPLDELADRLGIIVGQAYANDIVIDDIDVRDGYVASEVGLADQSRQRRMETASQVNLYARAQAAAGEGETRVVSGPVLDGEQGARIAPAEIWKGSDALPLSGLTLRFGGGLDMSDLRLIRRGQDIVIAVAGGGELVTLRGAAVRGAPTLMFEDGQSISGDNIVAAVSDMRDVLEANRAADGSYVA